MLDGVAEAHRAWLPHVSLVLGGAWMRPNPIGDMSEGTDTSFDMGDTCGSCGEAPHRELQLGEVPVISDNVGAVEPASDTSRGMPSHVGMSSCMQDARGGHGDMLRGRGLLSCPGDSSMAPMASGHAIKMASIAPDAWQHVLHVGNVGGGSCDEDGGDVMGAICISWVLMAAWMVLGVTGTSWDVCVASWGRGPWSGAPATTVHTSSHGGGEHGVASS